MENTKHYPTHPGAEHQPIMTCEIPLEEYESLKRENEELKDEVKRLENVRKVHIESIESMCEGLKLNAKQICKTQRALWLARAENAKINKKKFEALDRREQYGQLAEMSCDINGHYFGVLDFKKFEKAKKLRPYGWALIFDNVEQKCRAKAEEYK